jgi:dehydrogenase/reductase SDR family protein 1
VVVDHSNDKDIEEFFKKIEKDENGKLDVLVNNAFSAVSTITDSIGKPFYTLDPVDQWDSINGVGLRGHYLCTVYASRYTLLNMSPLGNYIR